MKTAFRLLGIIALIAVIGFSMLACDNGGGGRGGNSNNNNGNNGNNNTEETDKPGVPFTLDHDGLSTTITLIQGAGVTNAQFTTAKNNLTEAYYNMGHATKGKFIDKVETIRITKGSSLSMDNCSYNADTKTAEYPYIATANEVKELLYVLGAT